MNSPNGALGSPDAVLSTSEEQQLAKLMAKIQEERGFNCQFYKEKCLRRRLAVRMRARGAASYRDYTKLLDQDPAEYDVLLDALTINVTKFFRNLETWEVVEREVLPGLFDLDQKLLRVWSAGSSSGEEAYTCSMLMHGWAEKTGRVRDLRRVRIVGTDIDRRSLDTARRAEYPELSLSETPAELRERWFSPGPPYRLREEAKRNVSFVRRDLISEEPEPEQSLILCRNVIIYFDREIQERLFERFYEALVPGGYLVLGKVETLLGPVRGRLRAISNRERVFRKPE
jgi:chemotaxis protein methyltransferase CheR